MSILVLKDVESTVLLAVDEISNACMGKGTQQGTYKLYIGLKSDNEYVMKYDTDKERREAWRAIEAALRNT